VLRILKDTDVEAELLQQILTRTSANNSRLAISSRPHFIENKLG